MTVTSPFAKFIMRKADKAPNGKYWTAIQILKNAAIAGRLPTFNGRVSSVTWKRYFALVPPGLREEAVKVYQNYQRSVRYEKGQRELRERLEGRVAQKLSSRGK